MLAERCRVLAGRCRDMSMLTRRRSRACGRVLRSAPVVRANSRNETGALPRLLRLIEGVDR